MRSHGKLVGLIAHDAHRSGLPSEAGNVGIQPLGELAHGMGIIDAGATLHVGLAVHPAERRHDKVPATAERLIAGLGNVVEQPFVGFRARRNAHIGCGTLTTREDADHGVRSQLPDQVERHDIGRKFERAIVAPQKSLGQLFLAVQVKIAEIVIESLGENAPVGLLDQRVEVGKPRSLFAQRKALAIDGQTEHGAVGRQLGSTPRKQHQHGPQDHHDDVYGKKILHSACKSTKKNGFLQAFEQYRNIEKNLAVSIFYRTVATTKCERL